MTQKTLFDWQQQFYKDVKALLGEGYDDTFLLVRTSSMMHDAILEFGCQHKAIIERLGTGILAKLRWEMASVRNLNQGTRNIGQDYEFRGE